VYVWSVFLIDGFSFTVSWFCGKEGDQDNNDKDKKERDLKEKVEKGKEKKEDNMK